MKTYGQPNQIYLATWPYDPFAKSDYEPFIVVLIYSDIGFRAEYVFEADKRGEQIIGCPANSVLTITTWIPQEGMSLQEIASLGYAHEFNEVSYKFFKPLDEVSSMSIEGFYRAFVEKSETCISTPAEIWYSALP